jgi:adenylate cyclase
MLGKLVPCGGGPPIPLLQPKLVIGRLRTSDIPLGHITVSGRHCELELVDGYWFVRDLESNNGTRVNGKRCTSEWLLPDDILEITTYRYRVSYAPPAGRPAPQRLAVAVPAAQVAVPAKGAAGPPAPPAPIDQQVWEPALSMASLGKLVPCGGGPPIRLFRPRLVIGRNSSCDIVLRWSTVSGKHCELSWDGSCWCVRDLGSRNGTRVDGVPVDSQPLPPGSILWLGGLCFALVYVSKGEAALPQNRQRLFTQSLLEKAGLVPPKREATGKDQAP